MKRKPALWKLSLSSLPLLLCILFSALVCQQASELRNRLEPEEGIPSSILAYIHPAAGVCLLLAYGISIGIPLICLCRKKGD